MSELASLRILDDNMEKIIDIIPLSQQGFEERYHQSIDEDNRFEYLTNLWNRGNNFFIVSLKDEVVGYLIGSLRGYNTDDGGTYSLEEFFIKKDLRKDKEVTKILLSAPIEDRKENNNGEIQEILSDRDERRFDVMREIGFTIESTNDLHYAKIDLSSTT